VVVGAAVAVLLSFRLAHPHLDTDELTYANKVAQSMGSGSVLPVRASGDAFVNKPPLALWLMRASFSVFDPSPWSARLPSVVAGMATALLLYWFAAGRFGTAVAVTAAAFLVAAPQLLLRHGLRSATPDALEILLVTLAIVCAEILRDGRPGRRWPATVLVLAVAASAWVKSPFAAVVVVVYILATEPFARRAARGTPRLAATMLALVLAWVTSFAGWLLVLDRFGPQRAVAELVRGQYLQRVSGDLIPRHVRDGGYYARNLVADFGPLLVLPLAAAALSLSRRRGAIRPIDSPFAAREAGAVAGVTVWALAAPVLASLSASKQPWYAYLSYPGIALLLALSLWRLLGVVPWRWLRRALAAAAVAWFAGRLPSQPLWPPATPSEDGLVRLWHAVRAGGVEVRLGPELRFGHADPAREARFYVQSMLLVQRATAAQPCSVTLANAAGAAAARRVAALRPRARGAAQLLMIEDCGGRLLRQVAGSAPPATP
jgi:4-amino-4-deoxy-L-arabinose transferase-like glycosyltransferase